MNTAYEHPVYHPVAREILKAGFMFEVWSDKLRIPQGFSKSGSCDLVLGVDPYDCNVEVLLAKTRYDQETVIRKVDDLVSLAWSWYLNYKDRGYSLPEVFKPAFIKAGYIRVETVEVEKVYIND